ncbi:MAG: hypothetical protein GXP56_08505 [Deltaproteobacteria bacterium]|nr:hypothetical protein [Deltaproteobacteria bacterium]
MLGFGKKKKKQDKKEAKASKKDLAKKKKESKGKSDIQDASEKKKPKKKKISKKLIFIFLLVLVAVGASSYIVHTLYFAPKTFGDKKAVYKKIQLKHTNLPEEMIRFSFDYFPDLYVAMISFNREMDLFDREIKRIDSIAKKYPDQKKIANKEKKTWEKAKNTLQKAFLKIEKPIKETYVLFRVNKAKGLAQIKSKQKELTELALTALVPAKEQTQKIKSNKVVPKGFIKGTIYRLKKKFL